jgi:hypothetical protein
LLTIIGLSHAEDVANRATRCVPDDDHPSIQQPVADDPTFAVVPAGVINLDGDTFEDKHCVSKVEAPFTQSLRSLGRVEGKTHVDSVATQTARSKETFKKRLLRRLTFEVTGPRRRAV